MKRSPLRADPAKARAWRDESRTPLKRRRRKADVRARSWRNSLAPRCAHPTCTTPYRGLQQHHVVYRQHVRRAGGDEWDQRNGLTLCEACHSSHHRYGRVFPLVLLPDQALEFAFELLGPAAAVYLQRRYAGPASARFVELLAASEAPA